MKIYTNIGEAERDQLLRRSTIEQGQLEGVIDGVFKDVASRGDAALIELTSRFDTVDIDSPMVELELLRTQAALVEPRLKQAIDQAYANIQQFHAAQKREVDKIETMPGVTCWREARPIESVGLYVPGGSAPLISTVLMLGVPAQLAGCSRIVAATPPAKDGLVNSAIAYAALKCGVTECIRIGGAQAIAALAIGTESIEKVDKIFGPGNQYVTAAKMKAQALGVAIDMPAGPSEVLVIADTSAVPAFVAADLLSQAEHGPDSQAILITTDIAIAREVSKQINIQLAQLERGAIARQALEGSGTLVVNTLNEAIEISNRYAPEHLILSTRKSEELSTKVVNAGSVFLGSYTPESVGDYASGTNHSLPTNGAAASYSGVSLDSFVKMITFQSLTKSGLSSIAETVAVMAEAEGLGAHSRAVGIRLS